MPFKRNLKSPSVHCVDVLDMFHKDVCVYVDKRGISCTIMSTLSQFWPILIVSIRFFGLSRALLVERNLSINSLIVLSTDDVVSSKRAQNC